MKRITCAPVALSANTPLKKRTLEAPKHADLSETQVEHPSDPSRVHLYTYHLTGNHDVVNRSANRRYALSSVAAMMRWLKGYDGIYLELVPAQELQQGGETQTIPHYKQHLPGTIFGDRGYTAVIKGYKNNTGETLFVLPSNRNQLMNYLYGKLTAKMSMEGKFFHPLDANTLRDLVSTKPIESVSLLTKNVVAQLGRNEEQVQTYSLKELKSLYGQHFPYHFSSVYVFTDQHPGFKENVKGRPVLFYSKNPDGIRKVDDLIAARMIGSNQLGALFLDEDMAFHSMDELANHFYQEENGHKSLVIPQLTNETRLFMGPWFTEQLYHYFNDRHEALLQKYGREFQDIFDAIKDTGNYRNEQDRQNYIASQFLHFLLRAANEKAKYRDLLNDIDAIIKSKQGGVYISPGIVYNYLKDVPFAPVDTINEQYAALLDQKLAIKNMAKDPLSIPSVSLSLNENSIDQLFKGPSIPNISDTSTPITGEYQPGSVIHEDVAALYNELSRYGVTIDELSNVLHKKLLPLVQNEAVLDPALNRLLDEYNC